MMMMMILLDFRAKERTDEKQGTQLVTWVPEGQGQMQKRKEGSEENRAQADETFVVRDERNEEQLRSKKVGRNQTDEKPRIIRKKGATPAKGKEERRHKYGNDEDEGEGPLLAHLPGSSEPHSRKRSYTEEDGTEEEEENEEDEEEEDDEDGSKGLPVIGVAESGGGAGAIGMNNEATVVVDDDDDDDDGTEGDEASHIVNNCRTTEGRRARS